MSPLTGVAKATPNHESQRHAPPHPRPPLPQASEGRFVSRLRDFHNKVKHRKIIVKTLSPADRRALKARAHPLSPVVSIAGKGLTPSVLAEIDTCLTAHELIKIRVYGNERDDREALLAQVCRELHAAPVQHIGNILIVFREKPPEEAAPAAMLPAKSPARTAAKTATRKPAWGMKAAEKPLSKIKAAKTGQRRKIEYGQLRNTRATRKVAR